jgi:hypothetical protein
MTDYKKVMVCEELFLWLKSEAKAQGKRLGVFAQEYFSEIIAEAPRFDQPVSYAVSVKDLDLDSLKGLAAKSNMTVKQYVDTYYNESTMTPNEV